MVAMVSRQTTQYSEDTDRNCPPHLSRTSSTCPLSPLAAPDLSLCKCRRHAIYDPPCHPHVHGEDAVRAWLATLQLSKILPTIDGVEKELDHVTQRARKIVEEN